MRKAKPASAEPRLYSVRELAKATGASTHQIGHWVRRGILPRTIPAGPHTAYTEEHRLLLLAFLGLRAQGWDLRGAARELHTAPDARIRQVAAEYLGVAPEDVAPHAGMVGAPEIAVHSPDVALPAPQLEAPAATTAEPSPTHAVAPNQVDVAPPTHDAASAQASRRDLASALHASGPYRAESARSRELWEQIAICPGVFIGVRSDADTEARRVADEIQKMFGSDASAGPSVAKQDD